MAPVTRSKTARAPSPKTIQDDNFSASTPELQRNNDDDIVRTVEIETRSTDLFDTTPPVYTIDLSLPPAQRYAMVAKDYLLIIQGLTHIFDDLLETAKLPKRPFHLVARLILRKLYSVEQTEELRGISEITEVPMYLLVAYNVLLDLFMGCTSGGVRVRERGKHTPTMMHFRTLDWAMPELRKAIVQFEFVDRPGGEVIARTISYVGFVGVLTGVRRGLSLSLNFRPYHNNDDSVWANLLFWYHLLLVLLGLRPCITSHLRNFLIPSARLLPTKRKGSKEKDKPTATVLGPRPAHTLVQIADGFQFAPTTAAIITFCTSYRALVLEKDRVTAKRFYSCAFIAATNHDMSYETLNGSNGQAAHAAHAKKHHFGIGMKDLVEESMHRKGCIIAKWERHCRKMREKGKGGGRGDLEGVPLSKLRRWLLTDPVKNEETHFVTIMDPLDGTFKWVRCFEEGESSVETESD